VARKVRHARLPVIDLDHVGDLLDRHELEAGLGVPGVELGARVVVVRTGWRHIRETLNALVLGNPRCLTGRSEHQVAARVVHHAAAEREREVLAKPSAVIRHPAQELRRARMRGRAVPLGTASTERGDPVAGLASDVERVRLGYLRYEARGGVIIQLEFRAAVAVEPNIAGLVLIVPTNVAVGDRREPLGRSPENLKAEARHLVERAIS